MLVWSAAALPMPATPLPAPLVGSATGASTKLPEPVEPVPVVLDSPPAVSVLLLVLFADVLPIALPALSSSDTGPDTCGCATLPDAVDGSP